MASILDSLGIFFAKYPKIHYKKGEIILRHHDQPRGVFYLKSGFVRQYSIYPSGEEFTFIIFKPEDFFPIIWAINGSPYEYYMEAMTPVEVNCAPKAEFVHFLKDKPEVFWEVTSKVLTRMGGLLNRMRYLVSSDASHRIASILVICSERFGRPFKGAILIQVPLTHQAIADLLGISRETASVEIKKLERKGLIAYHKRNIVIKNLTQLEKGSLFD